MVKENEDVELLKTIPGVGPINATTIAAYTSDIERFDGDYKRFAAYIGIVPSVHNSNESTHYGRIMKHGPQELRTAMVQVALGMIRVPKQTSEWRLMKNYYRQKTDKGSGRAIIAMTRKISRIHSGKKTRCYSIKKADVIKFFKDLDLHPEKYVELGQTTDGTKLISTAALPTCKYSKRKLRTYYKTLFEEYEDEVLTVAQVSEITGYRNTSITSWIREEKLEAFDMPTMYMIPKVFLLKWLLSDQYNSIERKSKKHVKALWGDK